MQTALRCSQELPVCGDKAVAWGIWWSDCTPGLLLIIQNPTVPPEGGTCSGHRGHCNTEARKCSCRHCISVKGDTSGVARGC